MWWYILLTCIALSVSVLFAAKIMKTVVYESKLFVYNKAGEFLLVYDKNKSKFKVPTQEVPFDEIPTRIVDSLMEKILPGVMFEYDPFFHSSNGKYDRVRDDYGVAYCYETKNRLRKHFLLCYVLRVENYVLLERLIKKAPYPEFYSLTSMESMDIDIRPSKDELYVFSKIKRVMEGRHVANRKQA